MASSIVGNVNWGLHVATDNFMGCPAHPTLRRYPRRPASYQARSNSLGPLQVRADAKSNTPSSTPAMTITDSGTTSVRASALSTAPASAWTGVSASVQISDPSLDQARPPWLGFTLPLALVALGYAGYRYMVHLDVQQERDLREASEELYGRPTPNQAVPAQNSYGYDMALARIRQSTCLDKAFQFMRSRNDIRCLVDLERALEQNSICREPILPGVYSDEEVEDIYRLYLRNTGGPPDFGKLLQLREMLRLSEVKAREMEEYVQTDDSSFSI